MPEDEARSKETDATDSPEASDSPAEASDTLAAGPGPEAESDSPAVAADAPEEPPKPTRDRKSTKGDKRRTSQAEKRKPPPSEVEIDSPDWRTLVLLGVVFVVTAGSVGSARLACNYHPPESHSPPVLPTNKLAQTPKDAAIELAHRWATKNYDLARELAKGNALQQIEADARQCEKESSRCESEREQLDKQVVTSAVVLESGSASAEARVTSIVNGKTSHYRMDLVRDGAIWKVTARRREL